MFISTRRRVFIHKLRLVVYDTLSLCSSIYAAVLIRFGHVQAYEYIAEKTAPLCISLFIFLVLFYLAGLYEPKRFNNYFKISATIIFTVAAGILLNSFIFYATFSLAIGRGVFIITALFIAVLVALPRLIYCALVTKKNLFGKKILVIGTGEAMRDVVHLLHKYPSTLYHIIGIIDETSKGPETRVERESVKGYDVLGSIDDISDIVKKQKIDAVIVTTLEPKRHKILKNLRECRYHGVEIIDTVSLYEELEGQVWLKYIDDEWLFSSTVSYPGFHVQKFKRLTDIAGAVTGLILSVPFWIIAVILIKIDSKGPIFYKQERLGRYGKAFKVIKFRSMIHNAEAKSGPVWSSEEDPRITRIGRFIRKTRIDEIPQLINVLLGYMSLVGPRPERPEFIQELSKQIPFYPERLYVQPGLTGWAQINYPYASTIEQTKIKLQYDLYYIKHVSFMLDCFILFKTFKIILFGRGR